jgi:uncharacterized membrane protein YfcA
VWRNPGHEEVGMHADSHMWFFVASIGASALGGTLGMASGIFIVPFLTLVGGIGIHEAVAASIVSVIACSCASAASFLKSGLTNIRVAIVLETATTLGALTGVFLTGVLPVPFLFVLFAAVLLVSAWQMMGRRRKPGMEMPGMEMTDPGGRHPGGRDPGGRDPGGRDPGDRDPGDRDPGDRDPGDRDPGDRDWATILRLHATYPDRTLGRDVFYRVRRVPLGLVLMYGAGVISALLGIGSGVLKIPALDTALRLPIKVSSATSNFMIGATAAASGVAYFARGDIDPAIAGPVALGSVLGAVLGARLLMAVSGDKLRLFFVVVLVALAAQMLLSALGIHLTGHTA